MRLFQIIGTKMGIWAVLAQAGWREASRRKDVYVALILAALMIGAASTVGLFGVHGSELFLKDVTLTIITLFSTVLAALTAARQVPEEMERRTLYPLLARPLTRADFLIGKFVSAYVLSVVCLLLFAGIGWIALTAFGLHLGAIFGQFLLFRAFALAVVCALSQLASLVLPSGAAVTVALLVSLGGGAASQLSLLLAGSSAKSLAENLVAASWWVLPHVELFDISRRVSFGTPPLGPGVVFTLFGYALACVLALLTLGSWRFERRAL